MQNVPIQSLANQEFSVQLDNNLFDFIIRDTDGVISVSIAINTVQIIQNYRAVAGMRLIPSQYEEQGNFMFITANYQLPYYTLFNNTQQLIYISAAELAILRLPPKPRITPDFFNPIAALPLRFSPQGYT